MSTNGEMEIRFRKEDQQVLAALDLITAKLELVNRTASTGAKKATEEQKKFTDETKNTADKTDLLTTGFQKLGGAIVAAFAFDRIVQYGRMLDEIYQKLARNTAIANTAGAAGSFQQRFTMAEQDQISARILGMSSPLDVQQRTQLFNTLYQEAPGASMEKLLSMTTTIAGQGAVASGGKESFNNVLVPFASLAGKLVNAGFAGPEAMDLAKAISEQGLGQNGEKMVEFARRYASRAKTPDEYERQFTEALALGGTAVRSGEKVEPLEASLERLNQARIKTEVERIQLPKGVKGPDGKNYTERQVPVYPMLANDPRTSEELLKYYALNPSQLPEKEFYAIFGEKSGAARNIGLGGGKIDEELLQAFRGRSGILNRRAIEAYDRNEMYKMQIDTQRAEAGRDAANLRRQEALPQLVQETLVSEAQQRAANAGIPVWQQALGGFAFGLALRARRFAGDETVQAITRNAPRAASQAAAEAILPEPQDPMAPFYERSPGMVARNQARYAEDAAEASAAYEEQMRTAGSNQQYFANMRGGRSGYVERNSQRQPAQQVEVRVTVDAPEGSGISAAAVP